MTIQELLTEKGFTEGVDYEFDENGELVAIEKVTVVRTEISPAEYDEDGNEITPAVYDESQQIYKEDIPTVSELKIEAIKSADVGLVVDYYLSDKRSHMTENDSINIDLLLSGGDGWRFENIARPSIDDLFLIFPQVKEKTQKESELKSKIENGKKAREACQSVLDLVAGFNLENTLTIEQITQMQTDFGNIEKALRAGRPTLAKSLMINLAPSDTITQELIDNVMEILKEY